MAIDENGYYTLREILGYNAKWNIVLSDRGRGKTYGTKLFLMRQEGRFMCLYRRQPDLASAVNTWLDPLFENGYSREDFIWEGAPRDGTMQLIYQGQIKGYFRCLTKVNDIKQEEFPLDTDWIWLDEFIPLAYKKLPGVESEGDAIRTIYKTIDHDTAHPKETKGYRPLRVLLYANPFTWDNPILSYFKIDGLKGCGIHRAGPGVVWELLPPYEGEIDAADDFLGDEVNRNMGFLKQDAYVRQVPKGAVPLMSVRLGTEFYVFYTGANGRQYIRKSRQHRSIPSRWSSDEEMKFGSLDGLQEDEICLEETSYYDSWRRMIERGIINFDDINCKFDFLRAMSNARDLRW